MTKKIMALLTVACMGMGGMMATAQSKNKNVTVPVRVGITPGFSTQGRNDIHTTSNFSLNIYGGLTGSINGLELGSLFNINRNNMQYVQAAGLFNHTGGSAKGVQLAGLHNTVKNQVTGIQAASLSNFTGKNIYGIQMAGIHNQLSGGITGIQAAGISNYARGPVKGVQMAGIANINNHTVTGVQVAGIFNYTKHSKGLQIGLINIADTSDGYSIGLLTIVPRGYHKITVSSNEVLNTNVAIKTGNKKLYNILLAGINAGRDNRVFSYGYGIGREITWGKVFSLNPELTTQYLYLGDWDSLNQLSKLHVLATIQLTKGVALFAGPSFAVYYSDQKQAEKGYKFRVPSENYHVFDLWNDNVTGWFGWTVGVSFL